MAAQPAERRRETKAANATPLRTAIYARHSSSKQNPKSCDEQISHIRYLLDKNEVASRLFVGRPIRLMEDWVVKDEAISGKTSDRAGYQVILDAMSKKEKPFDLLLLDDLSRATRDLGGMIDLYNLAQYSGIEILSISDNLSSADPNAKMFFTVRGMINDWSNESHAMRTLRGMEAKVLKGLSCGDIPFGYRTEATSCDPEGVRRDFKIVIHEPEAEVVRRIFKLFTEGHGRAAICKVLNKESVPWPGFNSRPRRGKGWNPSTLHRIMHNVKYVGIWSWKRSTWKLNPTTGKKVQQKRAEHEAVSHHEGQRCREDLRIVSQSLWNRVHKVFTAIHEDEDHGIWGRFVPSVPKHMLSGLLKCAECGDNMVLICGRKGGYYGCLNAHRRGSCSCKKLVRRAKLERAIVGHVTTMLTDEAIFVRAAEHYNDLMREKMNKGQENVDGYEQEAAAIKVELANLAKAIAEGGSSETLTRTIEEKERRGRWLTYQIGQVRANQQEQVFVTPMGMRAKFKRLVDALGKQPRAAAEALQKLFPEGLKMRWDVDKWSIESMALMQGNIMKILVK